MAMIQRTAFIQAPVEKVFDYLNDPRKLPEYWPGVIEVMDVQPLPNGGTCFKYFYKMAGVRLEGKSEDTEIIPLKRMVSVSSGGLDAKITWEVEPADGGTRVKFENIYTVPLPVVGKIAETMLVRLNEHEADTIMTNLKVHMEG